MASVIQHLLFHSSNHILKLTFYFLPLSLKVKEQTQSISISQRGKKLFASGNKDFHIL